MPTKVVEAIYLGPEGQDASSRVRVTTTSLPEQPGPSPSSPTPETAVKGGEQKEKKKGGDEVVNKKRGQHKKQETKPRDLKSFDELEKQVPKLEEMKTLTKTWGLLFLVLCQL